MILTAILITIFLYLPITFGIMLAYDENVGKIFSGFFDDSWCHRRNIVRLFVAIMLFWPIATFISYFVYCFVYVPVYNITMRFTRHVLWDDNNDKTNPDSKQWYSEWKNDEKWKIEEYTLDTFKQSLR